MKPSSIVDNSLVGPCNDGDEDDDCDEYDGIDHDGEKDAEETDDVDIKSAENHHDASSASDPPKTSKLGGLDYAYGGPNNAYGHHDDDGDDTMRLITT